MLQRRTVREAATQQWEKIRSRYDPDKVFLNDSLRQFVALALLDEEKAQNQPVSAATEIVA